MVDVRDYRLADACRYFLNGNCLYVESFSCRRETCEHSDEDCGECLHCRVTHLLPQEVVAITIGEFYIHIYTDEKFNFAVASEMHNFWEVCELIRWARKNNIPWKVSFGAKE